MHECTLLCLKTKLLNNMFLLLIVLVCHIILTRLMQGLLTFIDYCKKLDLPCLIQAKTKTKEKQTTTKLQQMPITWLVMFPGWLHS